MIKIESLIFNYKTTPIFDNFNWQVQSGDLWTILGPSGCGKSTLLSLLAGLLSPISGTISVNNEALVRPRPQTGLILQDYGLLPWATVGQNASLGLQLRNFYGADGVHAPKSLAGVESLDLWLGKLGLTSVVNKYPGQISGGQRQRTAIARTLILKPDLLLMDEPFSSLDAPTRESLQSLTMELFKEEQLTVIMVTHSIEEAVLMGRKILLLNNHPNCIAQIIENKNAGTNGYRESREYQISCKYLRNLMNPIIGQGL
ncbi:MAG: ABC transporter ATP-binding protein [Chloroflexi bacterium]|nr:ABC transporter ATP-binding protein [Chloroflexota bacterium]